MAGMGLGLELYRHLGCHCRVAVPGHEPEAAGLQPVSSPLFSLSRSPAPDPTPTLLPRGRIPALPPPSRAIYGVPTPPLLHLNLPASTLGASDPSGSDFTGPLHQMRPHRTTKELSRGNPELPLSPKNPAAGEEGAGRRGSGKPAQLSPSALPPSCPASIPYSLPPRLGLGVWASSKLLSQTWAKDPEAAPRPGVREPLCKAAGHRVSDGRSCNSHGRLAGLRRLGSEPGIPLRPPLFLDTPLALHYPSDPGEALQALPSAFLPVTET